MIGYHEAVRLLLVEDDEGIVDFLSKGLREAAYAVDIAYDGEEALYQTSLNDYDVIILDVMIPHTNGFEVCRKLRDNGESTPVLMLTARDAVSDRIEGLDVGADDYLTKPFAFEELLARLRALLRRKEKQYLPSKIELADLMIDTKQQRVWRNKKEISLTAKEFTVIEYLSRNAGRVVGREEISEHCWDESYDPFSNSIEVFIARLRKKIDAKPHKPLIHTRRGAGYIMSDII